MVIFHNCRFVSEFERDLAQLRRRRFIIEVIVVAGILVLCGWVIYQSMGWSL